MIDFSKFDEAIKSVAIQNKFSGCIQITDHEDVIFSGAYGYASRAYLAENKINTKFNIASVGKMFTSVAVLQLVGKGILKLEVPIQEYCQGIVSE